MKIEEYGAKIAFQIKTKKPELDRIEYCVKQKNNGFERPAVIVGSTTEKVAMFIYIDEYFNKSLEPDIVAEIAIQEYAKGYKPDWMYKILNRCATKSVINWLTKKGIRVIHLLMLLAILQLCTMCS